MAHYLDKINKLSLIAGYTSSQIDKTPLTILEDEITSLKVQNESKREALKTMNEELEKVGLQLDALKTDEESLGASIDKELEGFHMRLNILKAYMETIETKEDFLINKVTKQVAKHNDAFYRQLKELHDRADEINKEFEQMCALQRECDELKQKAGQ